MQQYVDNGDFIIEANDVSAAHLAHEKKIPFVAGPALNIYNAHSLRILLEQGMTRWCMPVELSRDWLANTMAQADEIGIRNKFEVEVFSYGYLPLAYSARCFTARAEDKPKDECKTCCINYPQGIRIASQEGQEVFTLNGIQTQSGYCYNLINDLKGMEDLVDVVRISPLGLETLETVRQFRHHDGSPVKLDRQCNGYWHQVAGMCVQS